MHPTSNNIFLLGGYLQEQCGGLLDKYVEYDAVLLLLDLLLLKVQSYRHLLFNYDITTSVGADCA